MKKSILALICVIFATNYLLWALLNQPQEAPSWEGTIRGVSFTPFQPDQDPLAKK